MIRETPLRLVALVKTLAGTVGALLRRYWRRRKKDDFYYSVEEDAVGVSADLQAALAERARVERRQQALFAELAAIQNERKRHG